MVTFHSAREKPEGNGDMAGTVGLWIFQSVPWFVVHVPMKVDQGPGGPRGLYPVTSDASSNTGHLTKHVG